MAAWARALLFALGGVVAATGTAYFTGLLDPWLGRNQPAVSAAPEAAPQQPATSGQPDASQPQAAADDEAQDPETTDKQARLTAPSFDLLRVEPDGSVVVAGKAGAGSAVEIVAGGNVVAKAEANADGDFVAVLDEPLKPGDYQITLRSTAPGAAAQASEQTATVSVPETPGGDVLAMIEQPGAPAQLITVPEASPATEAPAEGDASSEENAAGTAPQTAQEQAADDASQDEGEPAVAAAPAAGEQAVAAAPEEQAAPAGAPASDTVVVEAVEIEGGTIFVAGKAEPGRTVRVYAGDILLGDARVSEGGRFLVEADRDLPVGSYVIRADMLGADGSVLARAAVPFEREPGENIAAVAGAPAQQADGQGAQVEQPAAQAPAEAAGEGDQPSTAPAQDTHVAAAPAQEAEEPGESGEASGGEQVAAAPSGGNAASDSGLTAPPLERADGAVIIRRGDSLWRISRRVYGMGVRYSTIYLANQDQIRDPNRIWPGQVFTVPGETAEGDKADMSAIGDQAVTPEDEQPQN